MPVMPHHHRLEAGHTFSHTCVPVPSCGMPVCTPAMSQWCHMEAKAFLFACLPSQRHPQAHGDAYLLGCCVSASQDCGTGMPVLHACCVQVLSHGDTSIPVQACCVPELPTGSMPYLFIYPPFPRQSQHTVAQTEPFASLPDLQV